MANIRTGIYGILSGLLEQVLVIIRVEQGESLDVIISLYRIYLLCFDGFEESSFENTNDLHLLVSRVFHNMCIPTIRHLAKLKLR